MKYCPKCGKLSLRSIETIDQGDEFKEVLACDDCGIIVNIFSPEPVPDRPLPTIDELDAILASEDRKWTVEEILAREG